MDRDAFWTIVDQARHGVADTRTGKGADEVAERVGDRLAELGREAAVAFDLRYLALSTESYDWNLWCAAYLLKGGCSDDAFDYFRGWLVAQGRSTWEQALREPDSLAGLGVDPDDDFLECEDMARVGGRAFDDDESYWAAVDAARAQLPAGTLNGPLRGADFDPDDDGEMRVRYPRLAAIYL